MEENKFTAARLVMLIVTAGFIAVVVLTVKYFLGVALMRTDITVYTKMKSAMTYYLTSMPQLPAGLRKEEASQRTGELVSTLVGMELIKYSDAYVRSIDRSIIFRNCGDHITEPLFPLCMGFAQEPGKITPLNVDKWPPHGSAVSSVPLRFACYAELILDDGDYESGNGFSNGYARFKYSDKCLSEPMEYDTNGHFDYLFSISGY